MNSALASFDSSAHQLKQLKVIDRIEQQLEENAASFSTVDPVDDYDSDPRTCLTSVHFPRDILKKSIRKIVKPLKLISPDQYYYRESSLHITIKNVRVINNPPHFDVEDIEKVKKAFGEVIPRHKRFKIFYYRLLIFPANLALVGTTDPELDKIILRLDERLKEIGVPDDKKYANSKYFFSNITLVRFTDNITKAFRDKVEELSQSLRLEPYLVDTVTLIKANASLARCNRIKTWRLS